MKKKEETEIPLEISVPFNSSQPIAVGASTIGEMLFFYYPVASANLLKRCMRKAKEEHRLELDKKYRAVFHR